LDLERVGGGCAPGWVAVGDLAQDLVRVQGLTLNMTAAGEVGEGSQGSTGSLGCRAAKNWAKRRQK